MPRIVSLGAALSAVLAGIGLSQFDNPFERVLPWFALVPFFVTLYANRHSLGRRWLDGLSFGWILCAWALHPLVQADLADAGGCEAGFGSLLWILVRNGTLWFAISFLCGVFAAGSGYFFRSRLRVISVALLALFWCGLEHIRTSFLPITIPWIEIGESIDPGSPESQVASAIGVSGLGCLLVFVNLAFATVIIDRVPVRQVLLTLVAFGIVVLSFLKSDVDEARENRGDEPPKELRLGVVQVESLDAAESLEFAGTILGSSPRVVVFPELAFLADSDELPIVRVRVEEFARREGVAVIAGVGTIDADENTVASADTG